jgi:hypothetical protein
MEISPFLPVGFRLVAIPRRQTFFRVEAVADDEETA